MICSAAGAFLIFSKPSSAWAGQDLLRRSQPQGYQQELDISLDEAYKGTTRLIQSPMANRNKSASLRVYAQAQKCASRVQVQTGLISI